MTWYGALAIGVGVWFGLWALGNGIRRGMGALALAFTDSRAVQSEIEEKVRP